jgi:RNA polymerase sigma-70 factor (ECF subfamily)
MPPLYETTTLPEPKSKTDFAELYDNYAAALYGVVCKLLLQDAACEDLLQDSFVKIWKNLDKYEPSKGTLFTWMLNITRNCCIDYLRSKQHQQQKRLTAYGVEHVSNMLHDKQALFGHERRELRQLAGNLDERYRDIVELVYIYGYTMEEVSTLLNMPLGSVKTRCRAAIKKMRDSYLYEQNK